MRLDQALVQRGLISSRNRAVREIASGHVLVNGRTAVKAAAPVDAADLIDVLGQDPWVARSAHKLLGALEDFGLEGFAAGKRCLDAGASTGGFTQVLLTQNAAHVYAVDVGHGQLAPEVSEDPRVTDLSGRNLRELDASWVDGQVDIVVADVSFISLTLLIDGMLAVTCPGGTLLLMVKPQFEAGRGALDKHGVVTSETARKAAVDRVEAAVGKAGARVLGRSQSHLPGPAGNIEYFLHVTT